MVKYGIRQFYMGTVMSEELLEQEDELQEETTVDDAFDADDEGQADEGQQEAEDTTAQEDGLDNTGQQSIAEDTAKPTAETNWAEFGLPQFAGRSPQEIANFLRFREKQYGDQANELGELRKLRQEYEQLKQQITGTQNQSQSAKPEDFDYKLQAFADKFNENPWEATQKFIVPEIREQLKKDLFEEFKKDFEPTFKQQAESIQIQQEWDSFTAENPDYQQYVGTMSELMKDEYLGERHPYKDIYNLSKLYSTNQPVATEVYNLMFKGFNFSDARKYAEAVVTRGAVNQQRKDSVKAEVAKANRAAKPAVTKKSAGSGQSYETLDDVVNSVIEDFS